jgi:hypothetical protein
MNYHISEFLKILRDNHYEQKLYSSIDEMDILPFTKEDNPEDNSEDNIGDNPIDNPEDIQDYFDVKASDSLTYYELNGYSDFDDLEDYLNENLNEFKIAFFADGYEKDKSLKNEIVQQVSLIKGELLELKETVKFLNDSALIALLRTKTNFCDEVVSFINNQENRIKPRRLVDPNNPNRLIQKEVVILFYHLRETGFIGKNIPNNVYAQYISDLTGYEAEKIRQDLSYIKNESQSNEGGSFQESDYDGIKRKLEKKLIKAISADYEEKFPPSA